MMGIINFIKTLITKKEVNTRHKENLEEQMYISEKKDNEESTQIASIWDYLEFNENTQAAHLASVIRFDEWVSMDEIRRRIWELFQIDYKNERSL
jgi:hypothetical protein